jgi:hypothetical protein
MIWTENCGKKFYITLLHVWVVEKYYAAENGMPVL